ncbi:MAG: redoxin family protein [Prolixibacteraceae bacterium]|nr:redoxin family protein [Burkholderiales bacterium]
MKSIFRLTAVAVGVSFSGCAMFSGPALALNPGERVDNFRLLDQNGASHELYYLSDAKAVVLMTYGNGCGIVQKSLPRLRQIRDEYKAKGVEFLLIDSNLQDNRDAVAKESTEFGNDLPILIDETQLIGEALGVKRTADVFVVDPKNWSLVYRGPLDDRLSYGAQKPNAGKQYLTDALDAAIAGKSIAVASAESLGCLVNFPERGQRDAHARISYTDRIAPLLVDKCVACHREGGVAPWAMTGFDIVRGFAPMIREVVRTKRMPPWHADPHYGSFTGDRSMTNEDTKDLVHWIEAGAPRGKGADPLQKLDKSWGEWTLGKPDLIVEVPAYEVPATGTISYQYPKAANPLGRDVWIRAIEILPGNRSVVHHVLAGIDDPGNGERQAIRGQMGELGGYAPGKNAALYPAHTGVLLRKEASFRFQMHYTPNGKAVTDVTRVGYYFYDKPPKHRLDMVMILDTSLEIPANAKSHSQSLEHVFDRDVMLYSLLPHAHLRGRAAKFTAHYPDGGAEILLSVPKYDFNWQPLYVLNPSKLMPAGTRVVLDMTWDNSAQNPANPDPNNIVRWGDQTWEEMNVGWFRFRNADDADRAKALQAAGKEQAAAPVLSRSGSRQLPTGAN